MTLELLAQDASDAEKFLMAWLAPFFADLSGSVGIRRRSGDLLPFGLIREITSTEDSQQMTAYPVVSVHWLAATEVECRSMSADGHRRIRVLARDPLTSVSVDGSDQNAEWVETVERPHWVDYRNDQIYRRVSRYRLALPFTDIEET